MNNSFEDGLKSKYWAKFKTIFNANILPQLSEIEKLRKRKIAQFFVICVLVLIGMIALGIFMAYDDYNHSHFSSFEAGLFAVFFLLILPVYPVLLPWIYTLVSKNYMKKAKAMIANLFAQAFGGLNKVDSNFNEDKYTDLIKKSELVNNFNLIDVDDLYEGNYEGINYTFSDTRFKHIAPNSAHVTTYSGIILHIKTSKPFLGHTKIMERGGFAYNPRSRILAIALLAIIIPVLIPMIKEDPYMPFLFWKINVCYVFGALFISILIGILFQHIKTQSSSINISEKTINKHFNLISSNKEEAKSLINKVFFEKLFELGKTYRTKSIRCAFFKDNIIIIIGTPKDIFEFGTLFKSAYNAENYKTYFKEIYPIFKLLHYLKNNSSISEYLN